MAVKNSFILYTDYYEHLEDLTTQEKGELLEAIFIYQRENRIVELNPVVKMAFKFIKKDLELNAQKWEETRQKRSDYGKLGGRPKKEEESKKSISFSEKAKKAVNDNVIVNVNDSVSVIVNENISTTTTTDDEFLIYSQEYDNILLSEMQYNSLLTLIGKKEVLQELIENLSQKVAEGKEPKFDGIENHFARLKAFWSYRKKNPEKFIEGFKKKTEFKRPQRGNFDIKEIFADDE